MAGRDCGVLVDVPAADGRKLEGILYEEGEGDVASVLHLHGKGGNCYSGPGRFVPSLGADLPVRHLALNMRCHDLAYTRYDVDAGGEVGAGGAAVDGGMWEDLDAGRLDVAAGVAWLRERADCPVYLSGHSAGGFYVGDYSRGDPPVAGRILLSPLTSVRYPLPWWFPGPEQVVAAREQAEALVNTGRGHLLLALPEWYYAISAAALVQRLETAEDRWVRGMNGSTAPVLLVWGSRERRGQHWEELSKELRMEVETVVLAEAGHSYRGHERSVANAVLGFVLGGEHR